MSDTTVTIYTKQNGALLPIESGFSNSGGGSDVAYDDSEIRELINDEVATRQSKDERLREDLIEHINATNIGALNVALSQSIEEETERAESEELELQQAINEANMLISNLQNLVSTLQGSSLSKSGDTMTGPLTLSGDPTTLTMAATKQYVDNNVSDIASQSLIFKGFISTTEPTIDLRTGNDWYNPSIEEDAPDISFPWNVKTYDGTTWSATIKEYTPIALDLWSNLDFEKGFYYFGQNWNRLDYNGESFDLSHFNTLDGIVKIANGAITDDLVADNADIAQSKISGLTTALSGKLGLTAKAANSALLNGKPDTSFLTVSQGIAGTISIDPMTAYEAWVDLAPSSNTASYDEWITDKFKPISAPDYAKIETINRISTNNGIWTSTKNGYVQVGATVQHFSANVQIYINEKMVFFDIPRGGDTATTKSPPPIQVSKGDKIRLYCEIGFLSGWCYFIPPRVS